jgi:hypothetical protein
MTMDRLVALPVAGESFLLHRDGKTVLVDGGHSSKPLAKELKAYDPEMDLIDIVVCTHADEDHAGGLGNLIDESGLKIGEFWLPGQWIDSVEELLEAPRTVADGLVRELDEIAREFPDRQPQEDDLDSVAVILDKKAIAERRRSNHVNSERPKDRLGSKEFDRLCEVYSDIPKGDKAAMNAFESARQRVQYRRRRQVIPTDLADYWLGLIKTAESIRNIAAQAIRHKVPVRWFDFEAFAMTRVANGGNPGFLEPLNSVEAARPPLLHLSYLAKLSAANEECLAFIAPPEYLKLGVVFCGDSPLGDGPGYKNSFFNSRAGIAPCRGYLVATAPHHGSESNAMAFGHLSSWARVITWLRTGGSSRQPGATFKKYHPNERACSHCPQTGRKQGLAELWLDHWYWPLGLVKILPHRCTCK